jgi:hypothetical protein
MAAGHGEVLSLPQRHHCTENAKRVEAVRIVLTGRLNSSCTSTAVSALRLPVDPQTAVEFRHFRLSAAAVVLAWACDPEAFSE